MLAGRSLLLPEEADRSDSAVPCPPRLFFSFVCLLLLLLHHGLEGFLEQGMFRNCARELASLVKVASQSALVNIWKSVRVIQRAVFICFWSCTASVVKNLGPGEIVCSGSMPGGASLVAVHAS